MWIRKNEPKISINIKSRLPYIGIKFLAQFLIIFFLILIISKLGIAKYGNQMPRPPLSWDEINILIPHYLFVSFIITIFVNILIYFNKVNKNKTKEYVCDKCNKIIKDKSIINCECGGVFVDIELMKWVDDVIENQ